jgi:hypothetical protein
VHVRVLTGLICRTRQRTQSTKDNSGRLDALLLALAVLVCWCVLVCEGSDTRMRAM